MNFSSLHKHKKLEFLILFAFILTVFFSFKVSAIASSERFRRMAISRTTYHFSPDILRGTIRDCNGRMLAYSQKTISLYMYPESLDQVNGIGLMLEDLNIMKMDSFNALIERSKGFTWIKRDISAQTVDTINRLNYRGIGTYYDHLRRYARQKEMAKVVGILNPEGQGISGIEYSCDRYLRGESWCTDLARNHRGILYPLNSELAKICFSGAEVYLTLNIDIQEIADAILNEVVSNYSAKGGVIIVMDPHQGDILAMASVGSSYSNQAISWSYEPGSTFKIVAAIAALSEKSVGLEEIVESGQCKIQIADMLINDAEIHPPYNFRDAVIHSSNVGFVNIALKTGNFKIRNYCVLFGFGEKTGINLPAEVSGYIPKLEQWTDVTTASAAFGQGISVTPLQLCAAYGAIANDGYLIKPRIVDRVQNGNGQVYYNPVDTIRRITTQSVADTFTSLLVEVVNQGTGINASVAGLNIAGKTGTAEISSPQGGYYEDKFVSSFIGFFPAESPRYLICVIVDEPLGSYYGGIVAAPAFRKVVKEILKIESYNRQLDLAIEIN